ncbi:nucleotidyltransferase family protein [Ramlibacter albus]|uniref:Nucleotidyltransferase family protein n=1 Tax=Ramlibacter albus TaxID=2079448 RepID=A0A923M6J3_9BURK|nr:nucleotidyltransferase family protein [Ramlibacter albus]MBC5763706.1 nucleotidyltransferase family protein [Ramlibacter albus]
MVLAAGRGERMRPLTDACPKPLLEVSGKPLMQYHLEALKAGGFDPVVVNTAWLGEQIEARYSQPSPALPALLWSREGRDFGGPLETAGGVARALPLLDDVFWVTASDNFVPGFRYTREVFERFARSQRKAHLWLVENPDHHPTGDFGITDEGLAVREAPKRYTYASIGLFRQSFFAGAPHGNPQGRKIALLTLLLEHMARGEVSAELYPGAWTDVGTPERLAGLQAN